MGLKTLKQRKRRRGSTLNWENVAILVCGIAILAIIAYHVAILLGVPGVPNW